MSSPEFNNATFASKSHRSGTLVSLIDPLSNDSKPSVHPVHPVETIDSINEDTSSTQQKPQLYSLDLQSQYTLDDVAEDPVPLTADEPDRQPPLRRQSTIQQLKEAVQDFNKKKPIIMILAVYFKIFVLFVGILAIYWGSFYKRYDRAADLKILVVVEDDKTVEGIPPYFGRAMSTTLRELPQYGNWQIYDSSSFGKVAEKHNNSIVQEVYRQVHHQKYWALFHMLPNATYDLYNAMVNLNTSFVNESVAQLVYETGRDLSGVQVFITPNLNALKLVFVQQTSEQVFQPLLNNHLSLSQRSSLYANASEIVTMKNFVTSVDYRPLTTSAALGPSLMGLVYCLVLSFHQFNFAARIHSELIVKLKSQSFITFRLVSSQITFVFLALVYSLMTMAFQVPVNTAFGRSGFLVLWATTFLLISSLGGINENVAIFINARNRVYMGFWIVFFIVINVSPSFYPIALSPDFFRYGYALPMRAGHQIMNVIFFNTWKGNLGRDYAILVAWIVVTNVLLPFSIKAAQKHVAKVAAELLEKEKKLN